MERSFGASIVILWIKLSMYDPLGIKRTLEGSPGWKVGALVLLYSWGFYRKDVIQSTWKWKKYFVVLSE